MGTWQRGRRQLSTRQGRAISQVINGARRLVRIACLAWVSSARARRRGWGERGRSEFFLYLAAAGDVSPAQFWTGPAAAQAPLDCRVGTLIASVVSSAARTNRRIMAPARHELQERIIQAAGDVHSDTCLKLACSFLEGVINQGSIGDGC